MNLKNLPTNLTKHRQKYDSAPDSKAHRANMGPIWGQQDPGGPHVGPMNFAVWGISNGVTYFLH